MRVLILITIIFSGCTKSSEDKYHHQAIILHNSMIKKANLIEHHLHELKNDSTINRDSVAQLWSAMEQWKSNLVEVPGNEAHSNHDHSHKHQPASDVTDEQMLAIQKELDQRLSHIGKRVNQLKPEANDTEHIH